MEQWRNDTDTGKTKYMEENLVPGPLCPQKITHGLAQERTQASAVIGRQLTAHHESPGLIPNKSMWDLCGWSSTVLQYVSFAPDSITAPVLHIHFTLIYHHRRYTVFAKTVPLNETSLSLSVIKELVGPLVLLACSYKADA
jgi:hypothetical protein